MDLLAFVVDLFQGVSQQLGYVLLGRARGSFCLALQPLGLRAHRIQAALGHFPDFGRETFNLFGDLLDVAVVFLTELVGGCGTVASLFFHLGELGFQAQIVKIAQRQQMVAVDAAVVGVVSPEIVHFGFKFGHVLDAGVFVYGDNEISREIDDFLKLGGLEVFPAVGVHEQVGHPRTGAAQIPDVGYGRGQLYVAHALAANL